MGNLKITSIHSVEAAIESAQGALTVKGNITLTSGGPTNINGSILKGDVTVATFNAYGVGGQKNVNLTGGSAEVTDIDVITAINGYIDSIADLHPDTAIAAVNTSDND